MFKRRTIHYLEEWKKRSQRKPLILRGARQVGKTSVVRMFAEQHFEQFVHINLEKTEHQQWFDRPLSLTDFEQTIAIQLRQPLLPGKTLLFFDEIQNSPHCLALLRFLYEERPDLHVIAAGSLLETKIKYEGLSLPVGRVEYIYLHPCDFFEYLEATGETNLLATLNAHTFDTPLSPAIHDIALRHFYNYAMVGGMPELVNACITQQSWNERDRIASALLTTYREDVYKYASSAQAPYLHYVIDETPHFAGTIISYEKYGQGRFKGRELSAAFATLETAMIVQQIPATQSTTLPLLPQYKRPKKMLFLDMGLINHRLGISQEYIRLKELHSFYQGRLAEQIVGQNMLALGTYRPMALYYWAKPKAQGSAEVDFCFQYQGKIIGLEVKAGRSTKLRSLFSLAAAVPQAMLVRLSDLPLQHETPTINGQRYSLLSVPFYLLPRLLSLIDSA